MFGRQTVRKCGLSRPGGEKLLMFGSFGCFETHELVAFEFCCLLELTYCVLACVSQQLGDQGAKHKDAKDSINVSTNQHSR